MLCVLDTSVAIAWVLPEEMTDVLDDLLGEATSQRVTVPAIWPIEIANVLLMIERRGRFTTHQRIKAMTLLGGLPLLTEAVSRDRLWHDAYDLAASHRLTVYDALYLEAALRLSLPLATLDRDLARAATKTGVAVLGQ